MTEMPIELVRTLTIGEGFEVKQSSGLLERGQENPQNDGYIQPAVFVVTPTEIRRDSVSFSDYEQREAESQLRRSSQKGWSA
jgi:hypothetical protein